MVSAAMKVRAGKGHTRIRMVLAKNGSEICDISLKEGEMGTIERYRIDVSPGDRIMLIPDAKDVWGMGELEIEDFVITRLSNGT